MTTKTLTGAYPSGYYLAPAYSTLDIASTAVVGGPGVTTSASHPSTIANLGSVTGAAAGIDLADGGMVVNGAAGATAASIVGTVGVYAAGQTAAVTNFATIRSVAASTYTGDGYDQITIVAAGPAVVLSHGGRLTNSGAAALVYGGVLADVSAATVNNGGTIAGGKFSQTSKDRYNSLSSGQAYAIDLAAGGLVSNVQGGLISGGIEIAGLATVINRGAIHGAATQTVTGDIYGEETDSTTNAAVVLRSGGNLTNMAGGYVGGAAITGGAGMVINYGVIGNTATTSEYIKNGPEFYGRTEGYSVVMSQGGSIANGSQAHAGASMSGGIEISGGEGVVDNFGAIGAPNRSSDDLGVISGSTGPSVQLGDGGEVVNGGPATAASIASGVYVAAGAGTVVNYGAVGAGRSYNNAALTGFNNGEWSIVLAAGGSLDNRAGAAHVSSGVSIAGGAGTVINQGVIGQRQTYSRYRTPAPTTRTSESYSVVLTGGGLVVNGGALLGGVSIGGSGTVVNTGTVGAASSTYVQTKTTTIITKGTIGYSVVLGDGTVTNGSTAATGADLLDGVWVDGGTVTNFGSIGAGTSGVAVRLDAAIDRLIEEASGRIVGKVIGGGGTLELAAAAGTGTIGGIGGPITGFSAIVIDAGAGWHFAGSNTLAKGTTLTNAAAIVVDGTLTNAATVALHAGLQLSANSELINVAGGRLIMNGSAGLAAATGATATEVINDGLLTKAGAGTSNLSAATFVNNGSVFLNGGLLDVTGAVSGVGNFRFNVAGASLEFRGPVAATVNVWFFSPGTLILTNAQSFAARLSLGNNATIDLRTIDFVAGTRFSYAPATEKGVLTVSDGVHTARIALLGQYTAAEFALSGDGHGGTDVTLNRTPGASPALATPGH